MTPNGKCRSCGAPILWVKMKASGKANPLDPEPTVNGNVLITEVTQPFEGDAQYTAEMADKGYRGPKTVLYISHFATCPNAKQHRKDK